MALPVLCSAQGSKKTNWEISGFLGASNYIGDLAPDLALNTTRPVLGVGMEYNFNSYVSAGGQINMGWIAGNDSNFESQKYRGLAFRSSIVELSGQMEFNFFRFGNGPRDRRFSPYLYTGLSFFKFNPIADYNGDKYYLQRMSTEGQGVIENAPHKYSLFQFAIPVGAGVKFKLSNDWNLSVHGAYRGTFTDYLDDVSGTYVNNDALAAKAGGASAALADPSGVGRAGKQRGNPQNKDWYVFAGISISYVLPGRVCYTF
jgi:hypothetical protein